MLTASIFTNNAKRSHNYMNTQITENGLKTENGRLHTRISLVQPF